MSVYISQPPYVRELIGEFTAGFDYRRGLKTVARTPLREVIQECDVASCGFCVAQKKKTKKCILLDDVGAAVDHKYTICTPLCVRKTGLVSMLRKFLFGLARKCLNFYPEGFNLLVYQYREEDDGNGKSWEDSNCG